MNFPKTALAAKLDGPEFETADGAISLSLDHMANIESAFEASEQLTKSAEQKATAAAAKQIMAESKAVQLESELAEQTELISQLTLQLEAAQKAPVNKTAVKQTGAESALDDNKKAHVGPDGFKKRAK